MSSSKGTLLSRDEVLERLKAECLCEDALHKMDEPCISSISAIALLQSMEDAVATQAAEYKKRVRKLESDFLVCKSVKDEWREAVLIAAGRTEVALVRLGDVMEWDPPPDCSPAEAADRRRACEFLDEMEKREN